MRIHELLLEYKRDITAQKMGKALLAAAQEDSHFIKSMSTSTPERVVDAVLAALEGMDPSRTKKYVLWLAKQYVQGKFHIEDSGRVQSVITKYIQFLPQFKRLGKNSDLNSYSFHDLERLMDELSGTELGSGDFDASNPDIKILYNGPLGTLCIPLTKEASCEVGRGTKWCTAATETENMFHDYADDAPLYVWRDRSGAKYQFWWGADEFQFMDSSDATIDDDLLKSFRLNHPVISKLFVMKEKEILLSENSLTMKKYAENVIKGRWKEAEPFIMKDLDDAYLYTLHVIKGRWKEAEPFIMQNPEYAFRYARNVIKGRWTDAEPYIMQNPEYAFRYAKDIIKGRWTDAEPYIMKDAGNAYFYALHVMKGIWEEAESVIMKIPEFAYYYARDVIKGRWKEAEPIIKTNRQFWNMYMRFITHS